MAHDSPASPDQLQAFAEEMLARIASNTAQQVSAAKLALVQSQKSPQPLQVTIQVQHEFKSENYDRLVSSTSPRDHSSRRVAADLGPIQFIPEAPLPEGFSVLEQQLKALNIEYIQEQARVKIVEHRGFFTDGLVLKQLPFGFSIEKHGESLVLVLSFNQESRHPPSAFMPSLKTTAHDLPEHQALVAPPTLAQKIDAKFRPILSKIVALGGLKYGELFVLLVQTLKTKNIPIDFLTRDDAYLAFTTPKGMRHLQKLATLKPVEQRWWNKLIADHLAVPENTFDFNSYFEVYTTVFLPKLAELNLSLPDTPPEKPVRNMLAGMARMADLLSRAYDKKAQCAALSYLDWGPLGAHYAVTALRFKQVTPDMQMCGDINIDAAEDIRKILVDAYETPEPNPATLTKRLGLWCHRFAGQHWHPDLSVQTLITETQKLLYPECDKKILVYILTLSAYSHDDKTLSTKDLLSSLQTISKAIQPLNTEDRKQLLIHLSQCARFKSIPTLKSLTQLVTCLTALKTTQAPTESFTDHILLPVQHCLAQFDEVLFSTLLLRKPAFPLSIVQALHALNDPSLSLDFALSLTCIDHAWTNESVGSFKARLDQLSPQKRDALLKILAQINLEKSKALPTLEQVEVLIQQLQQSPSLNDEKAIRKCIKQQTPPVLGDCVIGSGEVEALDTSLGAVIKDFFKQHDYQLSTKLDNYIKECIKCLSQDPEKISKAYGHAEIQTIIDAFKTLEEILEHNEQVAFKNIEQALIKIEVELNKTFNRKVGWKLATWTLQEIFNSLLTGAGDVFLKGILSNISTKIQKDFPKYTERRLMLHALEASPVHSLSILFKDEIIKRLSPEIQVSLNQLGTAAICQNFDESVLQAIKNIDTNQLASIGLKAYDEHIENLKKFLNTLAEVKNKEPEHFQVNLQSFMGSNLKTLPYHLQAELFSMLVAIHRSMPIHQTLPRLTNLLNQDLLECGELTEDEQQQWVANVERALIGLKAFSELLPQIRHNPTIQTTLFNMSVTHNMRSPTPFPLGQINILQSLSFDHKPAILNALMGVLKKLTPDTDAKLVDELLKVTADLLQDDRKKACPGLPQLLARLLSLVQASVIEGAAEKDKLETDLKSINSILNEINEPSYDTRVDLLINMLGKMASGNQISLKLSTLSSIKDKLQDRENKFYLSTINALFNTEPYPKAEALLHVLSQRNSKALEKYCEEFELNPLASHAKKTRDLDKHFSLAGMETVLEKLKDLSTGQPINLEAQVNLATQLKYLECLGKEAGHYTDSNGRRINKPLTDYKRTELKDQAIRLRDELRQLANSEAKTAKELQLLALLREIYFRSSGNDQEGFFPNPSQMLSLLISLEYPDNLLMQIRTGEGKSLIAPMLAAAQWMHDENGSVDLLTANLQLLKRDYEKNYRRFFEFLEIPNQIITKDSPQNSYKSGGINCSTPEDMMFYRLAAERRKERLSSADHPSHVIIDECDDVLFSQLRCNLVSEYDNEFNPHAWVYAHVRDFILSPQYQNLKDGAWTESVDIEQLRSHLNRKAQTAEQFTQLSKIDDRQLQQWLHAACIAEQLEQDKHFSVQKVWVDGIASQERVAVPLDHGVPKPGCSFADGIQPALHGRLQAEYQRHGRTESFRISPYPPIISSQSIRSFLKVYNGRLLGISGTPGDQTELYSLASLYGTKAISLPPHKGDTRKILPPEFTHSTAETFESIKKAILAIRKPVTKFTVEIEEKDRIDNPENNARLHEKMDIAYDAWLKTQTQPVLITTQSLKEARALQKALEKRQSSSLEITKLTLQLGYPPVKFKLDGLRVQLITGEESQQEFDTKLQLAGKPNTITISTKMLGRGTDIDPGNHPEGLRVIQTYVEIERDSQQIAGRSARNGKPGVAQSIFQVAPPKNWFKKILYYLFPRYRKYCDQRAVLKLQAELTQQETVTRIYVQAIGLAQSTMMKLFDEWEVLLQSLDPSLTTDLMTMRSQLLQDSQAFQAKGIEKGALRNEIRRYQASLCKYWEAFKKDTLLVLADKSREAHDLRFEQELSLNYLKNITLEEELKVQKQIRQPSKRQAAATQASVQQTTALALGDRAAAILRFDHLIDDTKKKELVLEQAYLTLPRLIEQLSKLQPEIENDFPMPMTLNRRDQFEDTLTRLIDKLRRTPELNLKRQLQRQGLNRSILALGEQFLPENKRPGMKSVQLCTQHPIQTLATQLCDQLAWAVKKPNSLEANLHQAAKALLDTPTDVEKAEKLYQMLQEAQLKLKNVSLFSLGRKNTRELVQETLSAIDALQYMPPNTREHAYMSQFTEENRDRIHDQVLVKHHLEAFDTLLNSLTPKMSTPIWAHLVRKIKELTNNLDRQPEFSRLLELQELLKRFSQYEAYRHRFSKPIYTLQKQVEKMINTLTTTLSTPEKIRENDAFMERRKAALKTHFKVEQIDIQEGHDGIESYVELELLAPEKHEGFTGYTSPIRSKLEAGRNVQGPSNATFEAWERLLNLSWETCDNEPDEVDSLPTGLQNLFREIQTLKKHQWNCNSNDLLFGSAEEKDLFETSNKALVKLERDLAESESLLDELRRIEASKNRLRGDELLAKQKKEQELIESEYKQNQKRVSTSLEDEKTQAIADLNARYKAQIEEETSPIKYENRDQVNSLLITVNKPLFSVTSPQVYARLKARLEVLQKLQTIEQLNSRIDTISKQQPTPKKLAVLISAAKDDLTHQLARRSAAALKTKVTQDQILNAQILKEKDKASYQVRRFFGPSCRAELLAYEAALNLEAEFQHE